MVAVLLLLLTTGLVRNNSLIAIEDLAVRNMVKNHKLARSISDAAWGEMSRQLEYKCDWYGRTLVKIDRSFALLENQRAMIYA
jgi:putative transposase